MNSFLKKHRNYVILAFYGLMVGLVLLLNPVRKPVAPAPSEVEAGTPAPSAKFSSLPGTGKVLLLAASDTGKKLAVRAIEANPVNMMSGSQVVRYKATKAGEFLEFLINDKVIATVDLERDLAASGNASAKCPRKDERNCMRGRLYLEPRKQIEGSYVSAEAGEVKRRYFYNHRKDMYLVIEIAPTE